MRKLKKDPVKVFHEFVNDNDDALRGLSRSKKNLDLEMGVCKYTGKACDGSSLICHLNPNKNNRQYRDLGDLEDRPFFNRKCSQYRKPET